MLVTKELIKTLIETNPGGCIVYQKNESGMKCLGFSDVVATAAGYTKIEMKDMVAIDPFCIVYKDDCEQLQKDCNACLTGESDMNIAYRIIHREGQTFWVMCRGRMIGELDGNPVMFATIQSSSAEVQRLLYKSVYDSEHDPLTGIYNRQKAYAECEKLLLAHPEMQFAIVHFDIQSFRLYNSFFGEKEGDKLLIYIANMFKELYYTHQCGVYGRVEADVFFLCFPMRKEVLEWNEKYVHEKLLAYRSDFLLAGSSGVYICNGNSKLSVEAMFNRAMEAAKGRANKQMKKICIYNEEMEEQMQMEQQIAGEMRAALEQKQFEVYLQPKYVASTGEPYGAEALVRWMHPTRGMISPGVFIPIFETNGFIIKLDQYVWERTCQLLKKWTDEGRSVMPVSVNVSRVSMYNPETVPFLKGLIEKYQISPKLLNLELTESAYMEDPEEMKERLVVLQEIGFEFMLDDFGSGYSSMNALSELTFNYLKVDRKFLSRIEFDSRSCTVLKTIIDMAQSMKMPVIAEGVETEGQKKILVDYNCEYIQGFLFAKPMPVEEYEKNIMKQCKIIPSQLDATRGFIFYYRVVYAASSVK